MDRKAATLARLRDYKGMKTALKSLRHQMRILKLQQQYICGARTDRLAVMNGLYQPEDWMVDSVLRQQELEMALEETELWLKVTEQAFGTLEPAEQTILQQLYMQKSPGVMDRLCQMLQAEKSTIYRRRDKALDKLALALYGAAPGKTEER